MTREPVSHAVTIRPAWAAVVSLFVMLVIGCVDGAPAADPDGSSASYPLHYLATAEQVGPVAYRDPLGRVSPDGRWFAYTERDRLHVVPVDGGATQTLGPGSTSMRFITWLPDSRRIAVRERVFDRSRQEWWIYDRIDTTRAPLWPEYAGEPDLGLVDMLAWSEDGASVAGVTRAGDASTVWVFDASGADARAAASGSRLSFPAWAPDGRVACLSLRDDRQFLHYPCDTPDPLFADQEAYGPVAFSPDGATLYYGSPGNAGFLDLWTRPLDGGAAAKLTTFVRDTYAPSVGADGSVVFKTQDYRTFLATAPADGGPSTPLTTFQSETPSWSWDGSEVAFTFGSWRHVTDDLHYPDIAQHIGVVATSGGEPRTEPDRVVRSSLSEDQAMHWSPNGRWIVFHTHESSDDIWLMPADGSAGPRMISRDGSETGWARWSANGRWIVFPSYRREPSGARQAHLFVIGVDEDSGEVTTPQMMVDTRGFPDDVIHGEWADHGETLIFEAAEAIGQKSLWRVPRTGGSPVRLHSYGSDQVHSGISVSSDGRWIAYVDRAADGHFQIFRVPTAGGAARQLTFDPTNKTQPAYSPAGDRVAFTVFSYRVHFWKTGTE